MVAPNVAQVFSIGILQAGLYHVTAAKTKLSCVVAPPIKVLVSSYQSLIGPQLPRLIVNMHFTLDVTFVNLLLLSFGWGSHVIYYATTRSKNYSFHGNENCVTYNERL